MFNQYLAISGHATIGVVLIVCALMAAPSRYQRQHMQTAFVHFRVFMGLGGLSQLSLFMAILKSDPLYEICIWVFGVGAFFFFVSGVNKAARRSLNKIDYAIIGFAILTMLVNLSVEFGNVFKTHSANLLYVCLLILILLAVRGNNLTRTRGFRFMWLATILCSIPLFLRSIIVIIWPEEGPEISIIIWTGIHGGFMLFLVFTLQMMYSISLLEQLKRLSLTDALTGLNNRRAFHDTYQILQEKREAVSGDTGLLVCDLDHFKRINDNYGHEKGDEVLKAFAKALIDTTRARDFVARIGGEEFVVILNNATEQSVTAYADRLLQATRALKFEHEGEEFHISTSIGAGVIPAKHEFKDPFKMIDKALYHSKETGRDKMTFVPLPRGS